MPGSIQFQRQMSEMSWGGASFPSTIAHSCASKYKLAPWQSIWTNHSPWLAHRIQMEHDIPVSCSLFCIECICGRFNRSKNLSSAAWDVNTAGVIPHMANQAPPGFNMTAGATFVCPQPLFFTPFCLLSLFGKYPQWTFWIQKFTRF